MGAATPCSAGGCAPTHRRMPQEHTHTRACDQVAPRSLQPHAPAQFKSVRFHRWLPCMATVHDTASHTHPIETRCAPSSRCVSAASSAACPARSRRPPPPPHLRPPTPLLHPQRPPHLLQLPHRRHVHEPQPQSSATPAPRHRRRLLRAATQDGPRAAWRHAGPRRERRWYRQRHPRHAPQTLPPVHRLRRSHPRRPCRHFAEPQHPDVPPRPVYSTRSLAHHQPHGALAPGTASSWQPLAVSAYQRTCLAGAPAVPRCACLHLHHPASSSTEAARMQRCGHSMQPMQTSATRHQRHACRYFTSSILDNINAHAQASLARCRAVKFGLGPQESAVLFRT